MRYSFPLAVNRELRPVLWEDLAHIDLVVMGLPVLVGHPPVAISLELVSELIFQASIVVPRFVFVAELTCPLTLS